MDNHMIFFPLDSTVETITISDRSSNSKSITVTINNRDCTPSSHSKNSATKICSKGWVAQKPFFDR